MRIGSIVETVADFEELRREWGLPYPKIGDCLEVSDVIPHPNRENRKKGIVLLSFKEHPLLMGICDKTVHGTPNFVELEIPDEVYELLNEPNEKK